MQRRVFLVVACPVRVDGNFVFFWKTRALLGVAGHSGDS